MSDKIERQTIENSLQLFLPKSIIESSFEAIKSRRAERDIYDLDIQVCFYFDCATQKDIKLSDEISQRKLELPRGYLICVDTHKRGENLAIPQEILNFLQKDYADQLKGELSLPHSLWGYAFCVAPLPPVIPSSKKKPRGFRAALNGDSMIYRLGFDSGKAMLRTRIPKTPDYYADRATADNWWMAFRDGGIARTSILLGNPDQLNTAFLPTREHLLLTFDAGRPYVVDPDTLELLEPTGATQEWLSMFPGVPFPFIFYGMQSPAHPVCDVSTTGDVQDEFFTTNYSTGYNGWLECIVNLFFHILFWINKVFKLGDVLRGKAKVSCKGYQVSYTHLLRYRFKKGVNNPKLERWRLVNRDSGKPVVVQQTLHQMGISEDYIILADISFKMEFSQIFSPFYLGWLHDDFWMLPILKPIRYWVGSYVNARFLRLVKPKSSTQFYIIDRKDLNRIPGGCLENEELPALPVTLSKIELEVSHFAVDYQNPGDRLLLHVGHNNNWDATEWITEFERSVQGRKKLRDDLLGINVGTMDLGSLRKYAVNARTGEVEEVGQGIADPDKNTWSLSVYTHRELCRDRSTETEKTAKNIFWMSWGFSWELIPSRIYETYKNDKDPNVCAENLPLDDKPMSLIRLDTEKMEIADFFEFPLGYAARSPQFIPMPSSEVCPEDRDLSIHGYIVCIVLGDTIEGNPKDEFWIFHAYDFKGQPIYRLSFDDLQLGLTLHSTWLPDLQSGKYTEDERKKIRQTSVEQDYKELVDRSWLPKKKELFNKVVYDGYIRQIPEQDLGTFFKEQGWEP
jgi:carotenoid cleavage dioxygenase-like enzyme